MPNVDRLRESQLCPSYGRDARLGSSRQCIRGPECPCGSSRSTSGSCGFPWSGRSRPAPAARSTSTISWSGSWPTASTGWGECASPSDPYYCPETTETCWHILNDFLAPAGPGPGVVDHRRAGRAFIAPVKGNRFARAGLEMACWDCLARTRGQPLHALLGRHAVRDPLGGQPGDRDADRSPARPDRALPGRRLPPDQAQDRAGLGCRSRAAGPRALSRRFALQVDANSAYTLDDLPTLKALDDFDLLLIEQPLAHDDIIDHARLQAALKTPICLDESIHSADDARKALDLGACRVINIKVSRLGGLLEAKRVHDLCHARGVPVWCGGMHEFGIGRAANVAIASLPGFTLPGDVSGSDKYYAEDIVEPPILAHRRRDRGVRRRPAWASSRSKSASEARTLRELTLSG